MSDLQLSTTTINAKADGVGALMDDGYLRMYDGVQPADADTAVSDQELLAELRFGTPAFGSAASGVITANPMTPEPAAPAGGTPTWFRVLQSDGSTVVFDGSVGVTGSGADFEMDDPTILAGADVGIADGDFVYVERREAQP